MYQSIHNVKSIELIRDKVTQGNVTIKITHKVNGFTIDGRDYSHVEAETEITLFGNVEIK